MRNAIDSQQYGADTIGYNATFNSIFEIGHQTSSSPQCGESIVSWNIVFGLNNAFGFAGYLVLTENPSDLTVTGSQIQQSTVDVAMASQTRNWAGYVVAADINVDKQILATSSTFNLSPISLPSTGCANGAPSHDCDLAIWNGVSDGAGDIAQAGVSEQCVQSGSSCGSLTLLAFYETFPNSGPVTCNPLMSSGDSITVVTNNTSITGGSSTSWDFLVDDTTAGNYCYTTNVSFTSMTVLAYGNFIGENYLACSKYTNGTHYNCNPLGKFATAISFSNSKIYVGSAYEYINSGYATQTNMENKPLVFSGGVPSCSGSYVDNANASSLNSNGAFTDTYHSSQNTPEYNYDKLC